MYRQSQINLQKQDEQLGYDILGRLFSAAENYYLKCLGLSYDHQSTNYSSYDMFHNANKKSKEDVRRELINQINIFQTSNQYYMNKYGHGLQPPNLKLAIDDLNLWKKSMKNPKDIELYDAIFKVINNNQVNTDNLSIEYQNQGYNKQGRQEFWSNVGTYSSAATQQRIEEINSNPNHQPTFNRGNIENPYSNSKPSEFDEKIKNSNEANKIIKSLIPQLDSYSKGQKYLINDISQNCSKLSKLINKINEKSIFIFPESIIPRQNLISFIDELIKNEKKNKDNKKIFLSLRELFEGSFV